MQSQYEWVRCWNCGRKLFRANSFCPEDEKVRTLVAMETKCHGCRAINDIIISNKGIEVKEVRDEN